MTGEKPASWLVWPARAVYLSLITLGCLRYDVVQSGLDCLWSYLISNWLYNSVYFETWYVTVVYAVILAWPYVTDRLDVLNMYKIDPAMHWHSAGMPTIILEAVEYCAPLMLLDTFMPKKYCGVDPEELDLRARNWIQHTRALPVDPPTVVQVVYQLVGAFILYDVMFYLVHMALHSNMWLYKNIHACHHDHDTVHSRVTNKLSIVERLVLVLSANQALKLVHAHPLSRTFFVPLFVGALVENHSGYDFPWTLDKVVPFRLVGGSPYHYSHHARGDRSYQPFFTYIDTYFNGKTKL